MLGKEGICVRSVSIAGLQLDLDRGNNLDRLAAEVRMAKTRLPWLDLIVLSELAVYGPSIEFAEPEGGAAETHFRNLARGVKTWLIPGTHFTKVGESIFNTAIVVNPDGEIVVRYHKIYPWTPYEKGVASGARFCTFDIPGVGRIGLSICYDLWFPEITRALAWQGAEILINPSLTNTIDRDVELAIARASAAQNQMFVFYVNGAGKQGVGRSMVCGPGGEVMHQAGSGREVFAVELDLDVARRVRERGWHGLGQPLKSFRDSELSYPQYAKGARSEALDALGPLAMPKSRKDS
jgi:deaminated glutathione amidase